MRNTTLMRVPKNYKDTVFDIAKKRGFPSAIKYLENRGINLHKNADALGDWVDTIFGKRKNKL